MRYDPRRGAPFARPSRRSDPVSHQSVNGQGNARQGVPAFYAESGLDDREHGFEWGQEQANDYRKKRYHQVSDEFDPRWDMGAALAHVSYRTLLSP